MFPTEPQPPGTWLYMALAETFPWKRIIEVARGDMLWSQLEDMLPMKQVKEIDGLSGRPSCMKEIAFEHESKSVLQHHLRAAIAIMNSVAEGQRRLPQAT